MAAQTKLLPMMTKAFPDGQRLEPPQVDGYAARLGVAPLPSRHAEGVKPDQRLKAR